MSDIVEQTREAREKLAAALSILQSPEAGSLIDSVAGPVAKAMGALHQIESSQGAKLKDNAPVALDAVRKALAALQTAGENAAGDQAMEHIAGSLGLIHGLAEKAKMEKVSVAPSAPPVGGLDRTEPVASVPPGLREAAARGSRTTERISEPAPAAPSGGLDATLPITAKPASIPAAAKLDATQASIPSPPMDSSPPGGRAPSLQPSPSQAEPAAAPQEDGSRKRTNSKHATPPPQEMPPGSLAVEANLGAHSPTNYYKGLSGNDVVNDGGLFVATYDIPKIGTKLWITVNMPGGYDFQAVAEVRWTRESGAGDASPGFGCAFQSLSDEARQLVYRYVKNREPLFHDDL